MTPERRMGRGLVWRKTNEDDCFSSCVLFCGVKVGEKIKEKRSNASLFDSRRMPRRNIAGNFMLALININISFIKCSVYK